MYYVSPDMFNEIHVCLNKQKQEAFGYHHG